MLTELVAVDEILGMGDQVERAGLLEHGRPQRRDRVLPTISECLADFASHGLCVLKCIITEAIFHAPTVIQLRDGHKAGLLR